MLTGKHSPAQVEVSWKPRWGPVQALVRALVRVRVLALGLEQVTLVLQWAQTRYWRCALRLTRTPASELQPLLERLSAQ